MNQEAPSMASRGGRGQYNGHPMSNGSTPALRQPAAPAETPESNQARAARYEDEKRRIIDSCFSKKEDDGSLLESYITHVRIIEDAQYPSSPPAPDSAPANKKNRLILVAVRKSGRVRVHKARENPSGSFSIGKTWPLDDLSAIHIYAALTNQNDEQYRIDRAVAGDLGFIVTLGKPYYWHAPTAKEKDFFIASLIKIFRKYTGGKTPLLSGFLPDQLESLGLSTPANSTPRIPPAPMSPPTPQLPQRPPQQFSPARPPIAAETSPQAPYYNRAAEAPAFQQPPPSFRPDTGPVPIEAQPSPARLDRRVPSRENMRGSPRPEVPSPASMPRDQGQTPPPAARLRQQSIPKPQLNERPSESSLGLTEKSNYPLKQTNGASPYSRPTPESSTRDVQSLRPSVPALDGSETSPAITDRPTTAQSATTTDSSQPTVVQEPVPDRLRPPLPESRPGTSDKAGFESETDSRFVTPATTPGAGLAESNVPSADARPKTPASQEKAPAPDKDYFASSTTPKPVEVEKPATQTSIPGEFPATSPLTPPQQTAEPEQMPSPAADGEHRPGLGPMVRTKAQAEVAAKFRRAAFAVNAFKPRQGGAVERLRKMQEQENKSAEPDGITGVVPAPLLRGMSSDSAKTDRPTTPATPSFQAKDGKAPPATTPGTAAPKVSLQRTATEDSIQSHDSQQSAKNKALLDSPAIVAQKSLPEDPPRPPTPEKARSRSPRRRKRQKQEAEIAKHCAALGIDPRLLAGRGADFNELLSEFGWNGRLSSQQKVDDFELEVRREIGRAQASGWLGHVEQQEGKVQELARAFDKAIEECEELDGLFTLYSHELDTLASDIEYIEAQSHGLQVQTANQKLLHNELQSLLATLTIPPSELQALQYGSLENNKGVASIEQALALLHNALQTIDPNLSQNRARRGNTGASVSIYADSAIGQMRAVRERTSDYQNEANRFVNRYTSHLSAAFTRMDRSRGADAQSNTSSTSSLASTYQMARQELWIYNGMMLFVREVNSYEWTSLMRKYEIAIKGTFQDQFRDSSMASRREVRKPGGEVEELLFTHQEKEKVDESVASVAARKLTVRKPKPKNVGVKPTLGERRDGRPEAWEVFQTMIMQQAKTIAEEQNFIVHFFHATSLINADFVDLVSARAPEERRMPDFSRSIPYEPDRSIAAKVQDTVAGIFGFWQEDLGHLMSWALSLDQLQGIGIMYALEHCADAYEPTNQEFVMGTVRELNNRLKSMFFNFVDEQVKAIEETKVKLKKRKGIVSFIRTFPAFSAAVESMMPAETTQKEALEVRLIVDQAYGKIMTAIQESLSFIAKDDPAAGANVAAGADPEDKEALNYHITLIENWSYFQDEVDKNGNNVLGDWVDKAGKEVDAHMKLYVDAVVRRPLGKWLDFVESTQALKQNNSYQGVAGRTSHSRSACKKVVKAHDSAEVRKGVDLLKKRIEKHFGEVDEMNAATSSNTSKSLIGRVFDACKLRYEHAHQNMQEIITEVYDGSLEIDWRQEDVAAMFRR